MSDTSPASQPGESPEEIERDLAETASIAYALDEWYSRLGRATIRPSFAATAAYAAPVERGYDGACRRPGRTTGSDYRRHYAHARQA